MMAYSDKCSENLSVSGSMTSLLSCLNEVSER